MENLDRLKHVASEHAPGASIIETNQEYMILTENGVGSIATGDKSDENVQWTIDLLTGTDPWKRTRDAA